MNWIDLFKSEFSQEYLSEHQKNRLRSTTRIRTELRATDPNKAVINTGAVSKPPILHNIYCLFVKGSEPVLREERDKPEFNIEHQQL